MKKPMILVLFAMLSCSGDAENNRQIISDQDIEVSMSRSEADPVVVGSIDPRLDECAPASLDRFGPQPKDIGLPRCYSAYSTSAFAPPKVFRNCGECEADLLSQGFSGQISCRSICYNLIFSSSAYHEGKGTILYQDNPESWEDARDELSERCNGKCLDHTFTIGTREVAMNSFSCQQLRQAGSSYYFIQPEDHCQR